MLLCQTPRWEEVGCRGSEGGGERKGTKLMGRDLSFIIVASPFPIHLPLLSLLLLSSLPRPRLGSAPPGVYKMNTVE